MISSDVNYIDFRYLNGACTIKVRFFGQEIAVGENTLHLVIICELLWQLLISPCASIIRFCNQESFKTRMHEIALDSNGKRLLVTSGLVRAPIYQVSITIWLHHLDLFSRNRFQWFICIPSGTRPWKWIEDTTAQFIYHKCGLASNTANVHHWVCRPLCPGHIYFMIYKQGTGNNSFPASMHWSLLTVLSMREARCHDTLSHGRWAVFLFCNCAVCLVLYPLLGCSNIFVVVNRPRIRIMWSFVHTREDWTVSGLFRYSNIVSSKACERWMHDFNVVVAVGKQEHLTASVHCNIEDFHVSPKPCFAWTQWCVTTWGSNLLYQWTSFAICIQFVFHVWSTSIEHAFGQVVVLICTFLFVAYK
jgi:hypothetical protein